MFLRELTAAVVLTVCAAIGLVGPWVPGARAEKVSTGDAKTDAMMVNLQKKAAKIRACTARTLMAVQVEGQRIEIRGKGAFRSPGEVRLEKTLPGNVRQTLVFSGGLLWVYDDEERIASRINAARVFKATGQEADGDQADPLRPFRGLQWKTIRYVGDETLDGEIHRLFEATPNVPLLQAQLPAELKKARIYLHPDDGLLRLIRFYDASGNEVLSQEFGAVVANPELDPSRFEFVIPAGAHVIDSTDEIIALLKSAAEE